MTKSVCLDTTEGMHVVSEEICLLRFYLTMMCYWLKIKCEQTQSIKPQSNRKFCENNYMGIHFL